MKPERGILVDSGWLRILGSGHTRLPRTLASWTQLVTASTFQALLIADDVSGGFFALNGGEFGKDLGGIYYLAPDASRMGEPRNQLFRFSALGALWGFGFILQKRTLDRLARRNDFNKR